MQLLLQSLLDDVPPLAVQEVIIGVFSTLVLTAAGAGLASTVRPATPHQRIPQSGSLEELKLYDLAKLVISDNWLAASVGMAAINSTFTVHDARYCHRNGADLLFEKGTGKILGVVGHFPFLERLKERFKEIIVFEKEPRPGDYREEDIPRLLPRCEIVALSGTTLINHSLAGILKWITPGAYTIMLGPSTPLSTRLFEAGFDALAGAVISDYHNVRHQVIQATPNRFLEGVRQVTLLRENCK